MNLKETNTVQYILRIAISCTYIGHGMFAILGYQSWYRYLQVVGFPMETAKSMVIGIGYLDILVALFILIKPNKYILAWAAIWAFATAFVRPFAGEPIWAFVERAANWGAPLVLLLILKNKSN
ncbi:MAG: hypothetical protein COB98_03375 [Flavobacteriaceae bacterium]|nr:MAG: hypothetical protein COB98_03375 [Flavobacteriaceae bacterium]